MFEPMFEDYINSNRRGEYYLAKMALERPGDYLEFARNLHRFGIGEQAVLMRVLGKVDSEESIEILKQNLGHAVSMIREAAVMGLAELFDKYPIVEEIIREFVKTETNKNVALTAHEFLGEF